MITVNSNQSAFHPVSEIASSPCCATKLRIWLLFVPILAVVTCLLAGCSRQEIKPNDVAGIYVFAHPDGWVESLELLPNFKYTKRFYRSIDDFVLSRSPEVEYSENRWEFKEEHPHEKPTIVLKSTWVRLDFAGLKSLETPKLFTDLDPYYDKYDDGGDMLVYNDENGYWAFRVYPKPNGGYDGIERLKYATDRVREWINPHSNQ